MSARITVLVRNHPNGGIPVIAPGERDEYQSQFTNAILTGQTLVSVTDSDGDHFNFVVADIQGFMVESL
ncbi:hypothetical protein SEA_LILMARTIN_134 [Streptomyces phage LilMartin]|nr:hypothetical protein SEA_LILMARTIN_134 [Streptomyces phage LilMartin]QNO12547.1 hypothetical protein SEA_MULCHMANSION_135 [Streptomyces phage MulchMansion]UVK61218.1 hypothetical protein SEA_ANGELA_136 [Streptomyces phage Angela]